jgi:pyridoxamine 5'-phosphate oxidase
VADVRKRFEGKPVTRPEFWSGFRVVPGVIELWTRDAARLHHRERFSRLGERWVPELLYP